ncbi:hypothetical protein K7X08_005001 [Anisodus acutangulus]|uniref:Uncharacterized protein n=1 Tax=Anisodus acutangulus TaxID=402998 RepID=A0A9Q1MEZ8_9SOLA|nr:hypothetical protein K7X08_005001 [Anisodus acutangulus]
MDIDLWWTLGGEIFCLSDYCMATLKNSHISQSFLYFIIILFIFLILLHSPHNNPSNNSDLNSSSSTTATMKLHPRKIPRNHQNPARKEYGAAAHEVPSGPNPISNK